MIEHLTRRAKTLRRVFLLVSVIFCLTLLPFSVVFSEEDKMSGEESKRGQEEAIEDVPIDRIQDNFARLREERTHLFAEIPKLRAERDQKQREILDLEAEEERLKDALRFARPTDAKSSKVVRAETEIDRLKNRLEDSKILLLTRVPFTVKFIEGITYINLWGDKNNVLYNQSAFISISTFTYNKDSFYLSYCFHTRCMSSPQCIT